MHYIDEGIDSGDIIDTLELAIDPEDTGSSLYDKVVDAMPLLLQKHLPALRKSSISGVPQDRSKAHYYPNSLPNGGQISWEWGKEQVNRFVRALYHPSHESAYTILNGDKFEILEIDSAIDVDRGYRQAGTFVAERNRLLVACGDGYIEIKKIKLPSGEIISEGMSMWFLELCMSKA